MHSTEAHDLLSRATAIHLSLQLAIRENDLAMFSYSLTLTEEMMRMIAPATEENVYLNRVLTDTVHTLPRGIRPVVHLDPDQARVMVDASALAKALANLIDNARDALQERADGRIALTSESTPESACVSVCDNGPGFDPEILKPGYTTKRELGHGLGLQSVKECVELAEGRMEIDSRPGDGATFTLWFPRAV